MNRVRLLSIPFVFILLMGLALSACAPADQTPVAEPTQPAADLPTSQPELPTETEEPQPTENPTTSISLIDALGREVVFEEIPQRIVVAGRATQLLADSIYLFPEAVDRVVGVEKRLQRTDFLEAIDPTMSEVAMLERDAGAEQIAPLNPDAVVMKSYMNETVGAGLEQIGVQVVYVDLETPEQFARDIRILGAMLANTERAEEIVAAYAARAEQVTTATAELAEEDRPRVLLLQHSETGGEVAFEVPPASWLQTTMVEMVGGQPVWADEAVGGGWQVVTFDQIAAWNPDQVYVIAYRESSQEVVDRLKADPQWSALQAVQNDQIYPFAADYLSWDQPDSRWILGLQWLATKIQPELFADLSILDEAHWFYTELYGFTEEDFQQQVIPLLVDAGVVEAE